MLSKNSTFAIGVLVFLLTTAVFFKSCSGEKLLLPESRDELSNVTSIMNPHALPHKGPWFEGWYARFVPEDSAEPSVGLIVASLLAPGVSSAQAAKIGLPGFMSILESQGNQALKVVNEQIESTYLMADDEFVERDPVPSPTGRFSWEAAGHGYLSPTAIDLKTSKGHHLQASISPVKASGFFELLGPEGPAVLIRAIPLHWFIYTPSARATWSLSRDSRTPGKEISGHVHFEKNWGKSFPKDYIWMQALSSDGQTSMVAAGGEIASVGPASLEAFLLHIRSPQGNWLFSPANGSVWTRRDVQSCEGRLVLKMFSLQASVEVTAVAERGTFGDLLIPTGKSLEAHSEQSFASQMQATVTTQDGRQFAFRWTGGALEFGGENKCAHQELSGR